MFCHIVQIKLINRTVWSSTSSTCCRCSAKNLKATHNKWEEDREWGRRGLPAPAADFSFPIQSSVSKGSSLTGRRWLSSTPSWCSFLQASKHTSCFAFWLLRLNGPTKFWNAALGGKVIVHSTDPFEVLNWKVGLGV